MPARLEPWPSQQATSCVFPSSAFNSTQWTRLFDPLWWRTCLQWLCNYEMHLTQANGASNFGRIFYIVIIKSCCTVILQLCVDILLAISHQAHRECYSRCPVTSWAELAGCLLPTIYVQVSSSLGNVILLEWSHIDLPKGATGKGSAVRHPYYHLYFE